MRGDPIEDLFVGVLGVLIAVVMLTYRWIRRTARLWSVGLAHAFKPPDDATRLRKR